MKAMCIDKIREDGTIVEQLEIDKIYDITINDYKAYRNDTSIWCDVKGLNGNWSYRFFRPLSEIREERINKILND